MSRIGSISALRSYPVKSMLGQDQAFARVTTRGLEGDRAYALVDVQTGKVVTAKLPHRWRMMLQIYAAQREEGGLRRVEITFPDGRIVDCADPSADTALSKVLGRPVRLMSIRPDGLEMERAHPDAVMAQGNAAEVAYDVLPVGMNAPEGGFFDFAPIHFITSASLDSVAGATAVGAVEPVRYRPNLIIETPAGVAFQENDWTGSRLAIGSDLLLEIILPTPRCAVPTLAHGNAPADVKALQVIASLNKIQVLDLGQLACLGAYAKVVEPGFVNVGDPVSLLPA